MKYKIIDNFMPDDIFENLHELLLPSDGEEFKDGLIMKPTDKVPWYYMSPDMVTGEHEKGTADWRLFYMIHLVYAHNALSPFYSTLAPHLSGLYIKALMRIKINMYPNTETIKEHGMHTDFSFSHKAAILSINTCDGYTKLEDGTKIDSVANRMLIIDGNNPHSSSTTSDRPVRINININYF